MSTIPESVPGSGWQGELRSEGIDPALLIGPPKTWADLLSGENVWYVTNPERLRVNPALVHAPWDVVIVDESPVMRNPKARISKIMLNGFHDVDNKAILTGCIMPENLMDVFNQMVWLFGSFCDHTNWYAFRNANFNQVGFKWFAKKGTFERIKDAIHRMCFVLTRKQAGVGNERVHEVRTLDLPPKIRKAYVRAERDYFLTQAVHDEDGGAELGEIDTKWAPVTHTYLQQLVGGSVDGLEHAVKVKELITLLDHELHGEQVVVWFRFNAEVDLVRKALRKHGVLCAQITGETPPMDRGRILARFGQKDFRVLLVQARCAKYGINASAADTAIWYSRYPDGDINSQCAERIESLSKKTTLLEIDLMVQGTIDEDLVASARDKLRMQSQITSRLLAGIKKRNLEFNLKVKVKR